MKEFLFSIISAIIFSAGIHLVIRYRTFSNFIAVVCILASFPLTYFTWTEYSSFPSKPVSMSLAEATSKLPSDNLWVVIKDMEWDCDHLYHINSNRTTSTHIFFWDKAGKLFGVATFNRDLSCSEIINLPVSGVLDYMSVERRSYFEENGVTFPNPKNILSYCTYCGKDNSKVGVLAGIFFFGGGIILLVVDKIDQRIKRNRYLKEIAQHRRHPRKGVHWAQAAAVKAAGHGSRRRVTHTVGPSDPMSRS